MTTLEKYNEIKTAYLSSLKTLSQSVATYDKYEGVLNDFGNFLERHYPTAEQLDIAPSMILLYKDEASKRGIKRNTLRHYLIVLRSFFKWCVQHKFYSEQPIFESDIPKIERIEYNLLTEQQIDEILNSPAPRFCKQPLRDKALITLLIESGLRVNELSHLQIGDLDFDSASIYVKRAAKGDKERTTTFPERSQQLVKQMLFERYKGNSVPDTAYVFENENGQPFTRQNITQVVRRYIKGITGRTDIGSHDLRHAYASLLLTNGCDLSDIQHLLGHSSYATTVIYASHLAPQRIANSANEIFNKRNEKRREQTEQWCQSFLPQ